MKWLLITNNGNPGDIWVRLGVQNIIRHLDTSPEWIIRERDYRKGDPHKGLTEPDEKPKFDYSVVCGMPMVWSHKEPDGTVSSTIQHGSWKPLTTWCKPEKMVVAGFGMYLLCPDGLDRFQMYNQEGVVVHIQKFFDRCKLVYARSRLARRLFPEVLTMHCPSVLAAKPARDRDLKLCNFMPGGSHYPRLAPGAAETMEARMPILSEKLLDAGFRFVAHRGDELDYALRLGWPRDQIFAWKYDGTGDSLLEIYGRCSKYIGNRVHGGIISRAVGAEVVVIGYDTRLAAVKYMNGRIYTPATMPDLDHWIRRPAARIPYYSDTVRHIQVNWWSTSLRLPIIR